VNFSVSPGEVFGLVGESGCGKSTVALQLLGYQHPSLRVETGEVFFKGRDLTKMSRPQLDRLRGNRISYVPQNPTTALNPAIRIGKQLSEILQAHGKFARGRDLTERIATLLTLVRLPHDSEFHRRYPHQLSGGQQQRVCIAIALACNPDLVVLDEPTTGLDVTTQEQIIELLVDLRARIRMSMLYVTHDLGLLAQIADRVGVMYAGQMVEIASTDALFDTPRHPYTRGLIDSIPRIDNVSGASPRPLKGFLQRQLLPTGCAFSPRCDFSLKQCAEAPQSLKPAGEGRLVACWRWKDIVKPVSPTVEPTTQPKGSSDPLLRLDQVSIRYNRGRRAYTVVRDISFTISEGETFALVGESGSGKSTIARAISGLVPPSAGNISLRSKTLSKSLRERTKEERRLVQFIFQNPDASLNPRARISRILARPLEFFFASGAAEIQASVRDALGDVRLDSSYAGRFPDELSGGERQRIAIARALVAQPLLLLCDEILSALDVSVQANILALLKRLKKERSIAMLFISHDLAVVRLLADHVCVLFRGEIMEIGSGEEVFAPPFHPYTHSLLQAVPNPAKRKRSLDLRRRVADSPYSGAGCVYAGRCPWQMGELCVRDRPPWRKTSEGHRIRCHLPVERLTVLTQWPVGNTNPSQQGQESLAQ
jgi:peptide/nickel transport system ATP-binding protein